LVEHFIAIYKDRLHTSEPVLLPETIRLLHAYPWPGNIRELENTIHRALLVCDGNVLRPENLNLPQLHLASASAVENSLKGASEHCSLAKVFAQMFAEEHDDLHDSVLKKLIVQAYEHSRQNQVQAAKLLGISRNVLRTQLKHFGMIE
jgi:sigma-54-specific transcriptional regulator